jgi:hypothetical protein
MFHDRAGDDVGRAPSARTFHDRFQGGGKHFWLPTLA